ncbi:alpha 1,2 mannosyltransferase [Saitoella coloradoensis]
MSLGVDLAVPHLVGPGSAAIPLLLHASSYTTLTYQAHTFSNGIETVLVVWSIVLCFRLRARASATHSALLGLLAALGIWTRITFPAFLLPAIVRLIPSFLRRSSLLAASGFAFSATAFAAILVDSAYFARDGWVITPLNNLMYNTSSANLALHGIHARYTHFVGNLPLLLGPALVLVFVKIRRLGLSFWCAMSGVAVLSIFPHQEPRFLLPAVPLILSSITSLPGPRFWRTCLATWVMFNTVLAILMGALHQGGVLPTLLAAKQQSAVCPSGERTMIWWETYTPPTWLLGSTPVNTRDMAGSDWNDVKSVLDASATSVPGQKWCAKTLLVAPVSAQKVLGGTKGLELVHVSPWHIGLDDLNFEDGVTKELKRVLGGLGLGVWAIVDAH